MLKPVEVYILNIKITKNNNICTLSNKIGAVLWESGGSLNFSGTRKKGRVACLAACGHVCDRILHLKLGRVCLQFKGQYLKWKRPLIVLLIKNKIKITKILDKTPQPHNGCRKKKVKR